MSEVAEVETTELVTLPAREVALQVYSTPGGLDPLIEQIREKVAGQVYDMTTRKGREECASDAYKVARSKAAIEKLGKALSAEYKEIPKKIDAERRRAFDELEALQAQVRQPLTEWEQAEEARVARHTGLVASIKAAAAMSMEATAQEIAATIAQIEAIVVDESLEEFEAEAHRAKAETIESLRADMARQEKHEAEQTELAELRRKQAEQERKDREAEIARQAAEKAKADAEVKARAEQEAAARREAQAKAAAEQAEREKQEAVERQRQAEARAEAERLAAEQRAKDAAEKARRDEIERQEREKAEAEAEQRRREANQQHRIKLMGEAKQALMSMNITEELARAIVLKIVRGEVPHVTINF